jgi:hypothetical protein
VAGIALLVVPGHGRRRRAVHLPLWPAAGLSCRRRARRLLGLHVRGPPPTARPPRAALGPGRTLCRTGTRGRRLFAAKGNTVLRGGRLAQPCRRLAHGAARVVAMAAWLVGSVAVEPMTVIKLPSLCPVLLLRVSQLDVLEAVWEDRVLGQLEGGGRVVAARTCCACRHLGPKNKK